MFTSSLQLFTYSFPVTGEEKELVNNWITINLLVRTNCLDLPTAKTG